jgi:hypothetical protein
MVAAENSTHADGGAVQIRARGTNQKKKVKILPPPTIKTSMDANLYGDYQKLLSVEVLGRWMEMPENNSLLRGLQYVVPQTISYGKFCWNGSCHNCTVTVRSGECESKALACRMDTSDGLHVTSASPEIKRLL